jgi:glycosyltransferase involved in cell wall biosynthesis
MRKLIIVIIGTRGLPDIQGGVEKHCQELYPVIAGSGINVTVLTRKPYVEKDLKEYKGVKLITIDCPKQKFLEAIIHSFKALTYAKRLKPDIIHIHAIGPAIITPFARILGFKVVFTHHGQDYRRKKWNKIARFVLKTGEAFGCVFSNRIIAISQDIAESIYDKFKKNAIIIPNGVVVSGIVPPSETIRRFNIQPKKYVLTVGRFVPEKGFDYLISTYKMSDLKGIKLVIVGDSDHEDKYSRELKNSTAGFADIILTGQLAAKPLQELYSNAGLFVLPSYYEGLPIALLEAMSYGLRCLASDIPANRCVNLRDENYFKAGDIACMSDKIKQFIDKPLSEDEKKEQINILRRDYDWTKIAKKTLEIYKELSYESDCN